MIKKPRILFTSPILHYPPVGGPELRIVNSIKALSKISELYVYSLKPLNESEELNFLKSLTAHVYISPSSRINGRIATSFIRKTNLIWRRLFKQNLFNENLISLTDYRDILRVANTINADLIWLGYGNISYPLLRFIKENSQYRVVCDTDSVWSRFILRGLPFAQNDDDKKNIEKLGKEKEEEERWGTKLADVTTAVSEVDATYYRHLAKKPEQIHIFSNVIDLNDYQNIPKKPKNFKNPCIYLAGTFWRNSPMEESARWMIEKVLPIVKKSYPDIHFYIIGQGSDEILNDIKDPSIIITGKIPSVLPFLCHVDAVVVPLKFESGTRFKILEAGACCIPVISTTLGAEGIPVTDGVDIMIADDPVTFANAINQILSYPSRANLMGKRLNSLIKEKYSINSLIHEGNIILKSIFQD